MYLRTLDSYVLVAKREVVLLTADFHINAPLSKASSGPVREDRTTVVRPRGLSRIVVYTTAASIGTVTLGVGVILYLATGNLLDVVRTTVTVFVGGAGVVALLLAARRQQTTELLAWQQERLAHEERTFKERVATASEQDALERRITELYTKATDQLGSEKAPVRLAGLYALERLAQNNPEQRQTIANVLSAYLRMPYRQVHIGVQDGPLDESERSPLQEAIQERVVRLTAQNVLAAHLRPYRPMKGFAETEHLTEAAPLAAFWPDIEVDLRGATLIDFDFSHCQVLEGNFSEAEFIGDTSFYGARFSHNAMFDGARFRGNAVFASADFGGRAHFAEATFAADVDFWDVRFGNVASFTNALFYGGKVELGHPDVDTSGAKFQRGGPGHREYNPLPASRDDGSVGHDSLAVNVLTLDSNDRQVPEVSIFTSGDNGEPLKQVVAHALDVFGLAVSSEGPIIRGSWLQRLRLRLKSASASDSVKVRLKKVEMALEMEYLGKARAEIDRTKADAVAAVLNAVSAEPSAVIRLGSLVIVKTDGGVAIYTISELEAAELEKNSRLIRDPVGVIQYIQQLKRNGVSLTDIEGLSVEPKRIAEPHELPQDIVEREL